MIGILSILWTIKDFSLGGLFSGVIDILEYAFRMFVNK